MGLFHFLKRQKESPAKIRIKINVAEPEKKQTERPIEEINAEYVKFREKEVERLNKHYDFNSIEGIRSIPVPCEEVNDLSSPTGRVEYYLRGQCWKRHVESGNIDIAVECLRKAFDLMYISDTLWRYEDFMSSISWLHNIGLHEEAKRLNKQVDEFFDKRDKGDTVEDLLRKATEKIDTHLVEVPCHGVCCDICAKYRNRIYTLKETDPRFPAFPSDFHLGCGMSIYPFVYGVMEATFECDDIIAHSNRPFVDDRTPDEKKRYEEWRAERDKDIAEKRQRNINRQEYFWMQEFIPEHCPKSLSGYSKMKNTKSKNYVALMEKAKEAGAYFA